MDIRPPTQAKFSYSKTVILPSTTKMVLTTKLIISNLFSQEQFPIQQCYQIPHPPLNPRTQNYSIFSDTLNFSTLN
ncbi:hypothetical protein XELAEV_18014783mg [Xenopus laevis]|uniref:Uncharacterized protein n=1 Tax=Xenopus laevis TaxID=8355 RepID=A0A974DHW8_XENLA|nr:hypothetical protein XELAEV_18014783mg [Xenopus laevis]